MVGANFPLNTEDLESLREWLRITAHRLFRSTPLYDTSDVVQDVLAEYIQHSDSLRKKSPKERRKWLYATLQGKVVDLLRKQSTAKRDVSREQRFNADEWEETVLDGEPSPDRLAEQADELTKAWAVMTELPELQQEALRLRFEEGLTNTEIAELFGCDRYKVARLLRRGLAQVQEWVKCRSDSAGPPSGPGNRRVLQVRRRIDD
jgi:RNA polymerase sigma factor (sigma-70 family)